MGNNLSLLSSIFFQITFFLFCSSIINFSHFILFLSSSTLIFFSSESNWSLIDIGNKIENINKFILRIFLIKDIFLKVNKLSFFFYENLIFQNLNFPKS